MTYQSSVPPHLNDMRAAFKQFEKAKHATIPLDALASLLIARVHGYRFRYDSPHHYWLIWAGLFPMKPTKTIPGRLTKRGAHVSEALLPVWELLDAQLRHPAAQPCIDEANRRFRELCPSKLATFDTTGTSS